MRKSAFEENIYEQAAHGQGSKVTFSTVSVKTGWKKKEKKVSMMWCLSVKSKADKCLVQTRQGVQESTKEDAMGSCVCVCVCFQQGLQLNE